jgi:glucokinase
VGGTKIAAGLLSMPEGRPLARRVFPTLPQRGGEPILDDVLRVGRELAAEAAGASLRVAALGLGICELVDREGRLASANLIPWLDLPVREALSSIAPAILEADVRAAAIAEARWGAGQRLGSFLYVTVGTGIACCLMIDGSPYPGARGLAGTMASSPLSVPCDACGRVNGSTLEDLAAGPALVKRFNAMGGQAGSAREVIAAAIGNPAALEIVRSAAETLASQIGLMVNVLDPEAVILGGGLGLAEGPYREHCLASIPRHLWSATHRGLPILPAATGPDAGWIGAATRAWELCLCL